MKERGIERVLMERKMLALQAEISYTLLGRTAFAVNDLADEFLQKEIDKLITLKKLITENEG